MSASAVPASQLSDSSEIPVDVPQARPTPTTAPTAFPSAIRRPTAAPPPAISVSELRAGMQQHLRNSGALKTLKTQLRGMVLTELMHQQKLGKRGAATQPNAEAVIGEGISLEQFEAYRKRAAASGAQNKRSTRDVGINDSNLHTVEDDKGQGEPLGGVVGSNAISQPSPEEPSPSSFSSWSACVADAIIENHLRRTRRPMSLSIFASEAEVTPLSDTGAPSEEEKCLRHLLMLSPPSEITDVNDTSNLSDDMDALDDPRADRTSGSSKKSLLQQLVEKQLLNRDNIEQHYRSHRHHCGTQTYEADKKQEGNEKNPLLSLECRLAAVDAKYALTFSQLGHHGDKSFFTRSEVERRLQQFKADIHEQLRAEYEHKYKLYEANKLQEVKDTLESRYQLLVRSKSEELAEFERSLQVKFDQDKQRLQQQRADVERRAMELDRRQNEVQKTIADRDLDIAHQEGIINSLKDKLRVLQLQCAKWEELSGSRLMEADTARARERRRLEEMQRMQAEHAAELRLKEEELSRLRFRLRTLLASPGDADGYTSETAGTKDRKEQRTREDLYRMLVRTEELQRNTLDQQKQTQRQHELELEERLKHKWDAAWEAGQQVAAVKRSEVPEMYNQDANLKTKATASPVEASCANTVPLPAAAAAAVSTPSSPAVPSPGHAVTSSKVAPTSPELHATPSPSNRSLHKSSLENSPIVAATTDVKSVSKTPSSKRTDTTATATTTTTTAATSKSTTASNTPDQKAEAKPKDKSSSSSSDSSPSEKGAKSPSSSSTSSSHSAAPKNDASEKLGEVHQGEDKERADITEEEDTARKSIEWTAKNQRSVLEAQERDRKKNNASTDSSSDASSNSSRPRRGGGGLLDRLEQQRQALRAQQEAEANIIYGDSDDDDAILFGDKSDDSDF